MSLTIDGRRQALSQDIGRILDDYLGGRLDNEGARSAVSDVFRTPTCRVAVADIARYLNRVLDMAMAGQMSPTEALTSLVNMELSFDDCEVYA